MQILWGDPTAKAGPSVWQEYGKMCSECSKIGHFPKVCCSRRSRVVNEMEQEVSHEYKEDDFETVNINSVCMNKH